MLTTLISTGLLQSYIDKISQPFQSSLIADSSMLSSIVLIIIQKGNFIFQKNEICEARNVDSEIYFDLIVLSGGLSQYLNVDSVIGSPGPLSSLPVMATS